MKKTARRSTRKTETKRTPRRAARKQAEKTANPGRKYELIGLACVAAGLISVCGLLGLNVGFVGLYFANFLHYIFGVGAFPMTLVILLIGWQYMTKHRGIHYSLRFFGLLALFVSMLAVWHHFVIPAGEEILPQSLVRGGGLCGGAVLFILRKFFGVDGGIIILGVSVVGSVLLSTTWSLANGLNKTQETAEKGAAAAANAAGTAFAVTADKMAAAGSRVEEQVAETVRDLREKRRRSKEEARRFQEMTAQVAGQDQSAEAGDTSVMPSNATTEDKPEGKLTGIMPPLAGFEPEEPKPAAASEELMPHWAPEPAGASAAEPVQMPDHAPDVAVTAEPLPEAPGETAAITVAGTTTAADAVASEDDALTYKPASVAPTFTIQYSSDHEEEPEEADVAEALNAIVHSKRGLTEEKAAAQAAVEAGNAKLAAEQKASPIVAANRAAADSQRQLDPRALATLLMGRQMPSEAEADEAEPAAENKVEKPADAQAEELSLALQTDDKAEAQETEAQAETAGQKAELGIGVPDMGDRPALGDYLRPSPKPSTQPVKTVAKAAAASAAAMAAVGAAKGAAELGTGIPAMGDRPALGGYLKPTPKPDPVAEEANKAAAAKSARPYVLPRVEDILEKTVHKKDVQMEIEIEEHARTLHQTLENFRVSANIINACHGPAVTRYELEPAPGVKVSKITNLAEDIALALAAPSVRIEPIPGKAAIGIEVPNSKLEGVRLREVLENEKFASAKSRLTVGLGKDIGGKAIFADLAKMPHLLVAGATGSGKSVCINTLICSILFKAKPDEVKFIFIDPKMVELSNYNGIPHLMVPVVTEAKKAASVLNWSVQEMEKRYAKFAEHNVRNMESYNKKFPEDKMPAIVIIIDELADLMMVAPHDVEDAICRLAQKARAAGIHMVLATQRPSVDVITGIIKANIPSRISFAVSSQIDSRTILDRSGAENLLGRGDMLFFPVGASKPVRVQGAFVSDEEVERLIDCIKAQGQEMETNEEIVAFTEKEMAAKEDEGKGKKGGKRKPSVDEKLPDVVDFIMGGGGASASAIQRRFRIGYNHAARLVETLEDMHIVGPSNGSKPREVTMSEEQAAQVIAQAMAEDAAG